MTEWDLSYAFGQVDDRFVMETDRLLSGQPKWRYIMKKSIKFAATAAAAVLTVGVIALFMALQNRPEMNAPASQPESSQPAGKLPTLHVLIDLTLTEDTAPACQEIKSFLESHAEGCGESYLVEVEALPTISEPNMRNSKLTSLHMEMATGGPDVFLLRNYSDKLGLFTDLKNFFPYPVSAMKQSLFLPLNDYIKGDPDWEKLLPSVIAAGKINDIQQIVPLSYGITVSLIDKEKYTLSEKTPMTCEQMLTSADPVLRWAACDELDMLGTLADYDSEKLTFSEKELLQYVKAVLAAKKSAANVDVEALGGIHQVAAGPLNEPMFTYDESLNYYMLPSYNTSGGVTARIETFAAASANTQYPKEAYAILKAFFSKAGQQNDLVTSLKLPVYKELGQQNTPGAQGWCLDDWDYRQLKTLQDEINAVEFVTPLDTELQSLFLQCGGLEDEAEIETAVHEAYRKMSAMIAES